MTDLPPSRDDNKVWVYAHAPHHGDRPMPWVGKWLIFAPPGAVDEAWTRISAATKAGTLGVAAKVSTRFSREQSPLSNTRVHVICVYVEDRRDQEQVGHILSRLRELGFTSRLSYKEDAATAAGSLWPRRRSLYVGPGFD